MTGRRRLGSLAATAAAVALVALGPLAYAGGDQATITHVETSGGSLQVLVSVPADAQVDLDRVAVTVDGRDANARAVAAAGDTTVRRTAILAIDTSLSMRGDRFRAARSAAQDFIDAVPSDVRVGIVTFAGDVHTALAPTQDRGAARTVLAGLRLSAQTQLYAGVTRAAQVAGTQGQRSLLVLSDGADTTGAPITATTSALHASGVLTDVVALDQSGADLDALQRLAAAGAGQVVSADPSALRSAFAAEAAVLAHQVLVTVAVPASVTRSQATIAVALPTQGGGTLTAHAFGTVRTSGSSPATTVLAAPRSGWSPPAWTRYAGPAALLAGLTVLLVLLVPGSRRLSPADRVTRYVQATQAGTASAAGSAAARPSTLMDTDVTFAATKASADRFLRRNRDLDARISRRLESAGSELKSSEWLLLHAAAVFVSALLGILVSGGNLVVTALFLLLGAAGPWLYLGLRRSRRRKAFNASLPDTLQLVSGSLSAGLSLAQSIDTIVREGQEPIASEFRRVLVETRLGVSLENALEGVGERFGSTDFEWVVMAIRIQRQVGGNLAELLDTVAATMREREYVRRQVAALAAEGKLSAYVLGGLPPLFMLYLLLTNYTYVSIMFHRPLGWAMLIGGATTLAVGAFWMSRLVKVEV